MKKKKAGTFLSKVLHLFRNKKECVVLIRGRNRGLWTEYGVDFGMHDKLNGWKVNLIYWIFEGECLTAKQQCS